MPDSKDYPIEVLARKARSTKTVVALNDMGPCDEDGRWQTVCIDHGGCVHHSTFKLASAWLSHPEDWCPECGNHYPKSKET